MAARMPPQVLSGEPAARNHHSEVPIDKIAAVSSVYTQQLGPAAWFATTGWRQFMRRQRQSHALGSADSPARRYGEAH